MQAFSQRIGGIWKTIPVLALLIVSALSTLADTTNEIQIAALSVGDKIYTNATITRVTPAYAVVSYQEGVVQIPMSDMPAVYQSQFGYTPEKAAHFLDDQKRLQKQQQSILARQVAAQARTGTNRPVRVTAIDDNPSFGGFPFCSVDGISGGILIENLPDSVRQFLSGYRVLQADVADCQQQLNNLKTPETPPAKPAQPQMGKTLMVGNGAGYVRAVTVLPDNTPALRRKLEDRLKTLNARLGQATIDYDFHTTIIAHPSGQTYVGKPIWVCVGVPAKAAK